MSIKEYVDKIIKEGTNNTSTGNWCFELDEFGIKNANEIAYELCDRKEVCEFVKYKENGKEILDIIFYLDYCKNVCLEEE